MKSLDDIEKQVNRMCNNYITLHENHNPARTKLIWNIMNRYNHNIEQVLSFVKNGIYFVNNTKKISREIYMK